MFGLTVTTFAWLITSSPRRKDVRGVSHYRSVLPALSHGGLGLPGLFQDFHRHRQLDMRGWHDMLRISPSLMGLPACGEDQQALPEHQSNNGRLAHEREWTSPVASAVLVGGQD